MPFTQVKAIVPAKMNILAIQRAILKEMESEGNDSADLFKSTTKTWQHDKPTFNPDIFQRGNDLVLRVEPTGNTMGIKKYGWLDHGTSVRWALMSRGWRSKTRPGVIGSGSGSGRVLVVGKRRMRRPRPGIKARDFSSNIYRKRLPKFRQRMDSANKKATQKLYG